MWGCWIIHSPNIRNRAQIVTRTAPITTKPHDQHKRTTRAQSGSVQRLQFCGICAATIGGSIGLCIHSLATTRNGCMEMFVDCTILCGNIMFVVFFSSVCLLTLETCRVRFDYSFHAMCVNVHGIGLCGMFDVRAVYVCVVCFAQFTSRLCCFECYTVCCILRVWWYVLWHDYCHSLICVYKNFVGYMLHC